MRIGIIAGEASGDLLGAGLLRAIQARCPDAHIEGIGGPKMIAAGCRSLYPMERLSVMGLFEVLGRYLELVSVRARLWRRFVAEPPDVFIGIDAPDFNLSLEKKLRQRGIRTVHYVSPSVWAWRRYRIRKIARAVDLMLTLFPFEARFYESHQVPAHFVGHPLADLLSDEIDRSEARLELSLPLEGEIVALLPGSRITELKHLAQPMVRTARWLAQRRAGLRFIAPLLNSLTRTYFETVLAREGGSLEIVLLDGRAWTAMAAADAVLLASGTATLEALLLKRPMVITYRTTVLTYYIMKAMLRVKYVGLPNLLADRQLVPELLQDQANPSRLGTALLEILEQPHRRRELRGEFDRIGTKLRRNADERAADAVLGLLQR